uniref:Methyltransferase FkbM domain-containing protein n=1 Tax=Amphora coffeiformis TaxID=265554 RepID=A0A7S3L4G6_9STRA|eukprot:scaffold34660_cov175-Amphora_coffeaeformis.AAC.3
MMDSSKLSRGSARKQHAAGYGGKFVLAMVMISFFIGLNVGRFGSNQGFLVVNSSEHEGASSAVSSPWQTQLDALQHRHDELQKTVTNHLSQEPRAQAGHMSANETLLTITSPNAKTGNLDIMYQRFRHAPPRPHNPQDSAECGTSPDFTPYFAQGLANRSANNEDQTMWRRLFSHAEQVASTDPSLPQPFTYIEIGAYNGRQESNTRFYDVCLGWKGLLVEANPHTSVLNALYTNRPTAHRMHFAASCSHQDALAKNPTLPFYKVLWTNAGQAVDVSNVEPEGWDKKKVDVPCGSLSPFIEDLLGGRVTFFSLDVENAEPLVLAQLDFSRIMVDVFMIENRNNNCGEKCASRDAFRAILREAGYLGPYTSVVTKSDVWVHPKSPFLQFL